MGNHKFRLSQMIPNAWFYKLNHSAAQKNPSPPPSKTRNSGEPLADPRKSYYITRELKPKPKTPTKSSDSSDLFFDPPRKSSRRGRTTTGKKPTSGSSTPTTKFSSSSSSSVSFRPPDHRGFTGIDDEDDDVVIDVDKMSLNRKTEGSVLSFELPPIKTERMKKAGGTQDAIDEPIKQSKRLVKITGTRANGSFHAKVLKEESMASSVRPARRFPTGSPRVRIRVNSPRISRRAQTNLSRRSVSNSFSKKNILSESLALAKSSFDPQKDFRESMIEMIVTNDIRSSKDLEELLACYLSLNSEEYHDVIIEAFRQIWFDLNNRRSRK